MPKTITISKPKITEVILSKTDEGYVAQPVYVLITDKDEEMGTPKRTTFRDADFTTSQKQKIKAAMDIFIQKIKTLEKL